MIRVLADALVPAHQQYLAQARQMQALSFAVHIPLVAFGISFPVLVLFAESRWLRTGDAVYRTLARRWTRIMAALFAVGVITGTILSFEMGLLWPNFTSTFGSVFGLGFAIARMLLRGRLSAAPEARAARQARTVVVGERGVADVGGEQHLVLARSPVQILAVGQCAVG